MQSRIQESAEDSCITIQIQKRKCAALFLALVVFVGLALLAGADSFKTAFLASYEAF